MNFFNELLTCGTPAMRKKKKAVLYSACATAVLICALLLALVIALIATAIANAKALDDIDDTKPIALKSELGSLPPEQVYAGELLLLDGEYQLTSKPEVMRMVDSDLPKTVGNTNAYTIGNKENFCATEQALAAFNTMVGAFYKATSDDNIYVSNAYNNALTSQSNIFASGTAFELQCFANIEVDYSRQSIYGVSKYKWVYNNAHRYGFVLVPEYDAEGNNISSTFRYVGVAHATHMKTKSLSLADYIEYLKDYNPDAALVVKTSNARYAVYYQSADEVYLPTEYDDYTVSGDNVRGFVITVKLQTTKAN